MLDNECKKGEQHLHFKIEKCKVKGRLFILNYISENVTLVTFTDTVGHVG